MAKVSGMSVGALLFAVSGWVVSLFLGLLELPAKVNSFFDEGPKATQNVSDWLLLDETYTGIWTSDVEGWLDASEQERDASQSPGGPVTLRMRVYNGRVEGEINSEGLKRVYVSTLVPLEGAKRDGGIDLIAYDYVDGKKTALAQIRLTMDGAQGRLPMRLVTEVQGGTFFPQEANLYRASDDVSEALQGGPNMELLRKVIEDANKERDAQAK